MTISKNVNVWYRTSRKPNGERFPVWFGSASMKLVKEIVFTVLMPTGIYPANCRNPTLGCPGNSVTKSFISKPDDNPMPETRTKHVTTSNVLRSIKKRREDRAINF